MSAASAKTQDPSMEEILASIRRIIADEGEGAKDGPPASAAAPNGHAAGHADDEDILDLADLSEAERRHEAGSVTELHPSGGNGALPDDLHVEMPDLSFQDVAPEPEPTPVAPPKVEQAAPTPAPPPRPPEPPVETIPPAPERIVSHETTASVGQAFNLLSHTVQARSSKTMEELVKEMLKPMLKDWLDDNLPPLVERLVRAEIERVARGPR